MQRDAVVDRQRCASRLLRLVEALELGQRRTEIVERGRVAGPHRHRALQDLRGLCRAALLSTADAEIADTRSRRRLCPRPACGKSPRPRPLGRGRRAANRAPSKPRRHQGVVRHTCDRATRRVRYHRPRGAFARRRGVHARAIGRRVAPSTHGSLASAARSPRARDRGSACISCRCRRGRDRFVREARVSRAAWNRDLRKDRKSDIVSARAAARLSLASAN